MTNGVEFSRRGFLGTALAGMMVPAAALAAPGDGTAPAAPAFRNPFVYRFKIGELDAWSISDANLPLREGLGLMWPEEDRPRMKTIMELHGEPLDQIPLYVNILVVRHGEEIAIFDAGFGRGNNPNMGWLEAGLAMAGISPDKITAAFLSHAHSDHLNGFVANGKPAFPNAALYLLPAELDFWRGPSPDFSKSKRDKRPLPNMVRDVKAYFDILQPLLRPVKDGTELWDGRIRVEAAPGHTAGHACFRIRSGKDELLHLMDLTHHSVLMFADVGWTIAFDHDPVEAVVTRKKFWTEAAAKRTRCFGFHLPWPGIGRIIPEGTGYRWWPERSMWV